MEPLAVDARALCKEFTSRRGFWSGKTKTTQAVKGINFTVSKGELFGILGPNGAGKTTTVKMLSTLLLPTSGSISIFGLDAINQTLEVRKRIGFTFGGARGLYGRLSAIDNLKYFAELYGLDPSVMKKRIPELLDVVGLLDRGEDRVETFSSGMQQRLHLARALLHDPELIFLDEPTVGIDPIGARELRRTIKDLIARGKTILLTTHYMAEAEELCDRIAIVKGGRVVALDSPSSLKRQLTPDAVVDIQTNDQALSILEERLGKLDGRCSVKVASLQNNTKKISIQTREPGLVMEILAPLLNSESIQGLEVRNQTLEDVYVSIIQQGD